MSHLHKGVRMQHFVVNDTGEPKDAYSNFPAHRSKVELSALSDEAIEKEMERRLSLKQKALDEQQS